MVAWPYQCPASDYRPHAGYLTMHEPDLSSAVPWTPTPEPNPYQLDRTFGYMEIALCRHCGRWVIGPVADNFLVHVEWYFDLHMIEEEP